MGATLDAAFLAAWSRACVADLRRVCAHLDDLNVFPVPDGDTGTNLLLTLAEALDALDALDAAALDAAGGVPVGAAAEALLRGALVGARGSSGVIVSQYLRGLLVALVPASRGGSASPEGQTSVDVDGDALARALHAATEAAYAAVGTPVEGTVLTVARAVARGAAGRAAAGQGAATQGAAGQAAAGQAAAGQGAAGQGAARPGGGGARPADVLRAGLEEGHRALAATPDQLAALRHAGVPDAGAAGLLTVLAALLGCLDPDARPLATPLAGPVRGAVEPQVAAGQDDGHDEHAHHGHGHGHEHRGHEHDGHEPDGGAPASGPDALREQHGGEFEVMYVVTADGPDGDGARDGGAADAGADAARADALRAALGRVGDSVAVVGGGGLWQAHVHTDDVVAALGAGTAGRPDAAATAVQQVRVRHLASQAGVHGAHRPVVGLVAVTRAPGLVADLARAGAVVVLVAPGAVAGDEVRRAVEDTGARDVVVLAVEGALGPDGDGPSRGEARHDAGTRTVLVTGLAEGQLVAGAATLASRAARDPDAAVRHLVAAVRSVRTRVVGDVGGRVEAASVLAAARDLLGPPGARAGALVTAVTGAGTPPDVGEALAAGLGASHPDVEVLVLAGGAPGAAVALAVEPDPDAPPPG